MMMSDGNLLDLAVPFIIYSGRILRMQRKSGGEHHGKFNGIDQEAADRGAEQEEQREARGLLEVLRGRQLRAARTHGQQAKGIASGQPFILTMHRDRALHT